MATATAKKETVMVIPPFGIEIDHPRNDDVYLQCITGMRLRSTLDGTKPIININKKDDGSLVPKDQLHNFATFPKTPGMQIHVNPAELTYAITDPMHGDEDLCAKVHRWIKNNCAYAIGDKLDGMPPQHGTLDKHRMKSLCRELFWLVEAGEAKRAKGPMPIMKDIEDLPGKFLLNPGSLAATHQPRFEDEYDDWADKVSRSGV